MNEAERIQRAWVLQAMREHSRAPRWLDDDRILAAFDLPKIAPPAKLRRENQRRLVRVRSVCSACKKTQIVGCASCWGATQADPTEIDQVAILRAAQRREILPAWLTDAALSRAYGIRRSIVAAKIIESESCESCGDQHPTVCLACLLRGETK